MKKILSFFVACFISLGAWATESVDVLTDEDAAIYVQIFTLQDKEKIDAEKIRGQIV